MCQVTALVSVLASAVRAIDSAAAESRSAERIRANGCPDCPELSLGSAHSALSTARVILAAALKEANEASARMAKPAPAPVPPPAKPSKPAKTVIAGPASAPQVIGSVTFPTEQQISMASIPALEGWCRTFGVAYCSKRGERFTGSQMKSGLLAKLAEQRKPTTAAAPAKPVLTPAAPAVIATTADGAAELARREASKPTAASNDKPANPTPEAKPLPKCCAGRTAKGEKCMAFPAKGSDYCKRHASQATATAPAIPPALMDLARFFVAESSAFTDEQIALALSAARGEESSRKAA